MAGAEYEIQNDNTEQVKAAIKTATEKALEMVGLQAEGYAKKLCPVFSGNLRNSITHTQDGEWAYIGTNVEYAPYVELGTRKMAARPYLRPAAADHAEEYRAIFESAFRNG